MVEWDADPVVGTPPSPRIEVVPGGPLRVVGVWPTRLVRGPEGWRTGAPLPGPGDEVLLCRCGRSSTMPRCDAAPPYGCFVEEPAAGSAVKPFTWDVPDTAGPAVALKPGGPVRVGGGVSVRDEEGRELDPGERTSLCRCGASRAQPLCDGSHKFAPFDDP